MLARPKLRDAERELLRFLANPAAPSRERRKLFVLLSAHAWLDSDHEILFEVIRELFTLNPQRIREHLPAQLARKGFPDVALQFLETAQALGAGAALPLARRILRSQ